jgi:uncharacterized protein (DUF433 family)
LTLQIVTEPVPLRVDAGGVVRVGDTRVSLDVLVSRFWQGDTPEQIVEGFPTVRLAEVYAILAYYLSHREEVDAYLAEQDRKAAEIRAAIEKEYPPDPKLRERLQARLAGRRDAAIGGG